MHVSIKSIKTTQIRVDYNRSGGSQVFLGSLCIFYGSQTVRIFQLQFTEHSSRIFVDLDIEYSYFSKGVRRLKFGGDWPLGCMSCCHGPQHTGHQIISYIISSFSKIYHVVSNCSTIESCARIKMHFLFIPALQESCFPRGVGYTFALNLRIARVYKVHTNHRAPIRNNFYSKF